MPEVHRRWRGWKRAQPPLVAAAPRPADVSEEWLACLAGRLDAAIDELLPPVEDAITEVAGNPRLARGDELVGRRAAHALERLAGDLGSLSAALRAGPPGR